MPFYLGHNLNESFSFKSISAFRVEFTPDWTNLQCLDIKCGWFVNYRYPSSVRVMRYCNTSQQTACKYFICLWKNKSAQDLQERKG